MMVNADLERLLEDGKGRRDASDILSTMSTGG